MAFRIELDKISLRPSGKNAHFLYYVAYYLGKALIPQYWLLKEKKNLLSSWQKREDAELIRDRVDYYCPLHKSFHLLSNARSISSLRWARGSYSHDLYEVLRYFPQKWKINTLFGDNISEPSEPSFVKSRPILGKQKTCVVMKLDRLRHFVFLRDRFSFAQKSDRAIFRGACYQSNRRRFMERWFGNPVVDCGDTRRYPDLAYRSWSTKPITLYDHLRYKFIVSLEGNDVASNLKWVMSSNSIAIMPRPHYETWFMEGRLIPGRHYIEIRDDFEDLDEKIQWYIKYPAVCENILKNAHAWVDQFRDPKRELLIGLLTAQKYFHYLQATTQGCR